MPRKLISLAPELGKNALSDLSMSACAAPDLMSWVKTKPEVWAKLFSDGGLAHECKTLARLASEVSHRRVHIENWEQTDVLGGDFHDGERALP